ncbi:hypothetical protein CPAR01_05194 [Colletotrichum paranaense]|uniref:Uncharacterized protein n=1 Tax=Colletotrichum paranaense TaxID=1914294 RepID=A0ABQ9SRU5_9PEZI|nr:uncharacterized protein CPAR01_05194 [Colletotrichum paranaense]KAK1541807.1 hypothetical protein CPAR01_05194 [Colletotrichum paranaense]
MHSPKGFPWPLRSRCPWRAHIRADLPRPATCNVRAKCVLYIALHREWGPAASRLDLKTTKALASHGNRVIQCYASGERSTKSFELSSLLMTATVDHLAASRPMLLGRTLKGRSFHVLLFLVKAGPVSIDLRSVGVLIDLGPQASMESRSGPPVEDQTEEARRLWRKRSLQKPDVASRTQVKVGGYSGDHLETKGYLDAGAVDRSPSGRLLIRCIEERSADDSDSSKCSKVFSLG